MGEAAAPIAIGAGVEAFARAFETDEPRSACCRPSSSASATRLSSRASSRLRARQMRAVVHHAADADHAGAGLRREGRDHGLRLRDLRRRSA